VCLAIKQQINSTSHLIEQTRHEISLFAPGDGNKQTNNPLQGEKKNVVDFFIFIGGTLQTERNRK